MKPHERALVGGSVLAVTLHAFDELSVLTVLPAIVTDLGRRDLYGAVLSAYLLASVVGLMLGGWLAARAGPARSFAAGIAVFVVGLALGAAAPSMPVLALTRALQGLGGGVISTVVLVAINRGFDATLRPRVLALASAAWVVPAVAAPAAASAIVEWWSWRWVFGALIPLALAAGVLALPAMARLGKGRTERSVQRQTVDALRIALGLGAVLWLLSLPPSAWQVVGLAAALWFAARPLSQALPGGTWRGSPGLPAVVACKLLLVACFFGAEAFLPLLLTSVRGTSTTFAGATLTAAALCWSTGAFVQSHWLVKRPPGMAAAGGLLMIVMAIGLLALLAAPATTVLLAIAAWGIAGFGMGVAYNTLTLAAMSSTAEGDEGATSTALGLVDALGVALATGAGGAVIAAGDRLGASLTSAVLLVWLGCALLALPGLRLTARLIMAGSEAVPER